MEGSSLLILLEKILSGRPGDAHKHAEYFNKLHESLLSANEATVRAALLATKSLNDKGLVNKDAAQKFLQYLKAVKEQKAPIPPELSYLTFSANPASQKSAKLFHTLIKLSNKRSMLLKKGIDAFKTRVLNYKNYQISLYQKSELKVQKCSSIVHWWLKSQNLKLERSLLKWRYWFQKNPRDVYLKVLQRLKMRVFYLKFLVVDQWKHETWVIEEMNQVWEDEEVYVKTTSQKTKRLSVSESFNSAKLSEILYFVTSKTQHMGNMEYDHRVQALTQFQIRQKHLRDSTQRLLSNIEEIVKLRKQLPIFILSKWQEKFVQKFEKLCKFELFLGKFHKILLRSKQDGFRLVQSFNEETKKEVLRSLFKNLIKNSLKYLQGRKTVLEKLKNFHSISYQTRVKYTKSVLNSVFKSTTSTQRTAISTWKLLKTFENNSANKKKVIKFIKVLVGALSEVAQVPLKFPNIMQRRENCLIRSVILACKNLRFVLNITFQRWLKTNRSQLSDRKALKKLSLSSLSRIIKSKLTQALFTLKKHQLSSQASDLAHKNSSLQKTLAKKTQSISKASTQNLASTLRQISNNKALLPAFKKLVDKSPESLAKKTLSIVLNSFHKNLSRIFRTWVDNTINAKPEVNNRLSEGNIVKSTLHYLNVSLLKRLKSYFQVWADELFKSKQKLTNDHIRSLKLFKIMQKVPFRYLKVSFNRITSATDKILKSMENLYYSMKRKPKHAFDTWRFNAIKIRKLNLINKLRAEKLVRVLNRVPNKKLRRSFNCVVGTSIKIKHAMRNLIDYIRKRLRERLTEWKNFCNFCMQAELDLDFRVHKFCSLLNSPIKKPLRTIFSDLKPKTPSDSKKLKNIAKIFKKRLSSELNHFKSKTSEKSLGRKIELKVFGFKLQKLLELPIRSTLKSSFNSIFEWKNIMTRALYKLCLGYNSTLRAYLMKWKSITDSHMLKNAVQMLKILKIRGAIERLLKRTLREASNRLMQGARKIEYTMDGLINGLKGIPRKAIRRWNKVIVEIKEEELINHARGHKLLAIIQKIPRRLLREMVKKIDSNINVSISLKYSFNSIEKILKRLPKSSFEIWKKYLFDIRNQSIIKDYNTQIFKIDLEKIVKRTIRDAMNCIKHGPRSVKKALNTIISGLTKSKKLFFLNWVNLVKIQQQNDLINKYKLKMIAGNLHSLCRKRLRDAVHRIIGGGDKIKGLVQGLMNGLNKIPKVALLKWNKAVIELREHELKTNLKGSKLMNFMKKVPARVLNDACERINGNAFMPRGINASLIRVYYIWLKKTKEAFERWKKFLNFIDRNYLIDQLRQAKLQLTLTKISTRVLRSCLQLIMGEGNKIKGAFYIYISALLRRPKMAFDKWKFFIYECQQRKLINHLKLYKLKGYFSKICARKLRDATQRIIGGGNKIKGAIQNLVSGLKNIPTRALLRWSKYTSEVKEKRLLDNFRSEKLRSKLSNLLRRSLRRTFKKIFNDQGSITMIKSMFRWLENIVTVGTKICFNKWKDFTSEDIKRKLRNTIKGQTLEKLLNRVVFKQKLNMLNRILRPDKKIKQAISLCSNSFRKKPQIAFNKLKSFTEFSRRKDILSELTGERVKKCLEGVVKKLFCRVVGKIQGFNEVVGSALVKISTHLKTRPKVAIQKWHKNVENLKRAKYSNHFIGLQQFAILFKNQVFNRKRQALRDVQQYSALIANINKNFKYLQKLFTLKPKGVLKDWLSAAKHRTSLLKINRIRGRQLASTLRRLIHEKFRNDHKKCQRFRVFHHSLASAIRSLKILICSKLKKRLGSWKQNTQSLKREKLVNYLKCQKLKQSLERLSRKSLRDATQRIIGEGDKAKGALRRLIQKVQKKPKTAFNKWRSYLTDLSKKNLINKLRGQKLKENLLRIGKRPIIAILKNLVLDKNRIKGAINTVINNLTSKPKQVIKKWKSAVQYIREKALIDFFRGEKLSTFAEKLVQRTRNDTFGRVTGKNSNPQMVYLNLRWVQKVFQQKPRAAFNKWKDYIEDLKRQKLLSNIKSHKLMVLLGKASRKKLRDYVQRVLGEGDKVKGAIKTVISAIRTKTKEGFNTWLKYTDNISKQKILRKLKTQKFLEAFRRIMIRTLRTSVKRLTEDEDKVKIAVNTVVLSLQIRPRQVIKKWKQNIHILREKFLMKDVQSEKLRHSLENICKRTVRKALHRITSVKSNSIIAGINLKWINRILQRRPKGAFDVWKSFIKALITKALNTEINSQKLKNLLEKVTKRTYRGVIQRILGEGNRVKGALKHIYLKISRLPQNSFVEWKKAVIETQKRWMFNELRSAKLLRTLNRIVIRTSKGVLLRIFATRAAVKEMMMNLLNSLKAKKMQAFARMKQNMERKKLSSVKEYLNGKRLQDTLQRLVKKNSGGFIDRLKNITRTTGQQKIERLLKSGLLKKASQKSSAFSNWKEKVNQNRINSKLEQARGKLMGQCLNSLVKSQKQNVIKSLLKTERVLKNTFNRAENLMKSGQRSKLDSWKKSTFYQGSKRLLNRYKAGQILAKLVKSRTSSAYSRLTGQGIVRKALDRLVTSQYAKLKEAISAMSENVRKKSLIDKVNGTYKLYKVMKPKPRIILEGRFTYWKNLEELRIYRLKKKVIMKWIYMSSINYQNSFWKLKYVWNMNFKYFDPRHSLMYRKLCKISSNYQTRLKQYAHFKLVMYYKTMPYPIRRLASKEMSPLPPVNMKRNSEYRALAFLGKPENIAAISKAHTPKGYRKAFSRAHSPVGFRELSPVGFREYSPERNVEIVKIEYNFE